MDGKTYVAMAQVKCEIFSKTGNGALRSMMHRLQIKTVLAKDKMRLVFDKKLGPRKGGQYLVNVDDLKVMLKKRPPTICFKVEATSPAIPTAPQQVTAVRNKGLVSPTFELPGSCDMLCESGDASNTGKMGEKLALAGGTQQEVEARSAEEVVATDTCFDMRAKPASVDMDVSDDMVEAPERTLSPSRVQRTQPIHFGDEIELYLKEMKTFYTIVINPIRASTNITMTTMERHEKRIRQFMSHVQLTCKRQASVTGDVLEIELTTNYVNHLTTRMNNGTAANHVQSLIVLAKYILRKRGNAAKWEDVEEISHLRHMQSQLQNVYERERKKIDPTKDKKRSFQWGQVLETLKEMKQQLEMQEGGQKARPRLYHDFVILLMFTSISPSRNLDMMRLRIVHGKEPSSCRTNEEASNWLVFEEDGTTEMVVNCFKTSRTYGCNRIKVSDYEYVDRHLKTFVNKERSRLLGEKRHDFLFVRPCGEPFHHSQSFSTYIEKAFEKYNGGLKFTTTTLRKSLVNWLIDTEKDQEVRNSVARLMSHSSRVQQLRYNTMDSQRKMKRAADHLSSKMTESLGVNNGLASETYLPFRDQIVAVVADDSTYGKPHIYLGKVIGLRMEEKKVALAELIQAGDPTHYQMNIGTLWEEELCKVVHPIDVAYLEGENVYVLRTPRRDIHQFVVKNALELPEEET